MQSRVQTAVLASACILLGANLWRPASAASRQPDVSDVVRARRIELLDDQGRPRATLKVEENGETLLRLFDARGTIRVKLGAGSDGSGLILMNEDTQPAVHILARDTTSISLSAKDKSKRIEP